MRWRYCYDAFGRRIGKRQETDAAGPPVKPTAIIGYDYLWSGEQLIEETPVYADGTVGYEQSIHWLYEPGALTSSARYEKGQLYYVVSDHQGTVREILTEDGELIWAGRLLTWGEAECWRVLTRNDERNLTCHLRFCGQYEDEESGLFYNRHRYYDRETGQYLSPDPLNLSGGFNPYSYVHNPANWIDPLGLAGKNCQDVGNKPKNAQEMAEELANQLNKNTVTFSTPTTMGHIDLRGRAHFDKITQTDIPTPHVQTSPINIAPNGKRFPLKKQEVARPATKQDIRTARELAKKQGILK